MNPDNYKKSQDESIDSYILRLCDARELNDWTWEKLAYIANQELGFDHSESWYRKRFKGLGSPSKKTTIQIALDTLKKEKMKLSDERIQNNACLRRISREETLKEIASEYAQVMSKEKFLDIPDKIDVAETSGEGIIVLSDWHYGIEFSNAFNDYSPAICRSRVAKLTQKTIEYGKKYGIRKLHVTNLSDLICGRIHLTLRLQSRIDVITQTMDVCEILAEMLTELSKHFIVEYRDVLDNHSRVEPKKSEAMDLESFARLIPWYLKTRMTDNPNIKFFENDVAEDIITFESCGHNIAAVHGHKDSLNKLVDNMIAMTQRRNDLVLSAHLHHMSADEEHFCIRFSNGSLMGVDDYAENLRLSSRPSQTFIHVTEDNVIDAIHVIPLN